MSSYEILVVARMLSAYSEYNLIDICYDIVMNAVCTPDIPVCTPGIPVCTPGIPVCIPVCTPDIPVQQQDSSHSSYGLKYTVL